MVGSLVRAIQGDACQNNLTEINHKVSVPANRFFRHKRRKCPAGGCEGSREGVMQDAFPWAHQASFSTQMLASLRELNHRFLDLAAAHSEQLKLPQEAAAHVARLSAQERSEAAYFSLSP